MRSRLSGIFRLQQAGLVVIIFLLGAVMTAFAGTRVDRFTGRTVNNFLNPDTLLQIATDTSFFAIMAVGMTMVIVSGGIDLSVGSIYAMAGVLAAMVLRGMGTGAGFGLVLAGLAICAGVGLLAGLANGVMVCRLGVHPFIITLGTMWVYRGIAFVTTKAESILMPAPVTGAIKATLGLRTGLYPVPLIATLVVALIGALYLSRTTWGRRIFAVGGNIEAARYAGLRINRVLTGVYVLSGLAAGIAAFLASAFYGSASSGDAQGYELYVIASAVVGGASLSGGKGSAVGAVLGALLITMIRQAIRTLRLDQNYEWIIIGVAIVVAVVVDRLTQAAAQRKLARG
ncbi:MAG: ABC transporter permease [Fimbriimonas sp.]